MNGDADTASVANLIGDRSRAALLQALMDSEPLSAKDLAARAGIAPSTASEHLAKLLAGHLIVAERVGRQRYFRLTSATVAQALELLASIAPRRPVRSLREANVSDAMQAARTCYDHLAGALGVGIADALHARGVILSAGEDFAVTEVGQRMLGGCGIDVRTLRQQRRPLTRACLDWTEQRPHIAGSLGAALANHFIDRGWVTRLSGTRALKVSEKGRKEMRSDLGVEI